MKKVIKAGCILIQPDSTFVGLIYRKKHQDYTFPKGHKEGNETIEECAIRETVEETQRNVKIITSLGTQQYINPNNEDATVHWFLAKDDGPAQNEIEEDLKHDLIWTDINEVRSKLSYENLKELWDNILPIIRQYLDSKSIF